MTYHLSRRARRDVLLICRYIAQDNEPAADRFIDRLMRAFQLLGDNPTPAAGATNCAPATAASPSANT